MEQFTARKEHWSRVAPRLLRLSRPSGQHQTDLLANATLQFLKSVKLCRIWVICVDLLSCEALVCFVGRIPSTLLHINGP
jgi:hypothetical protein